jgi:hypothetical protein
VLLRFLLVEAAQVTVRSQQEWRSKFFHLAMRRGRKMAKVAMARELAVHLYWIWRQGCDSGQTQKLGSYAGEPGPARSFARDLFRFSRLHNVDVVICVVAGVFSVMWVEALKIFGRRRIVMAS